MLKMLYGLQAKLDRPLAALLGYGALCAADFLPQGKPKK